MTELKHTLGPWRTGDLFKTVFGPPNGKPSPRTIARDICTKADAQLIAAAPEMLDALLLAQKALNAAPSFRVSLEPRMNSYDVAAIVDRAVNKAKGE